MKISKEFLLLFLNIICWWQNCQSQTMETAKIDQNSLIERLMSIIQSIIPIRNCQSCFCGTPNTIKRIVGGKEVENIRYPWITLIKNNSIFNCGGSLVSDRHILTAAHCLNDTPATSISISLLVHDRTVNSSLEINRKAKFIRIHENYDTVTQDNDIGIIYLDEPVEMSNLLRSVCIPQREEYYVGKIGIVSGWGAIYESGPQAEKLKETSLPIISNEECKKKYSEDAITDNMLCAGVPDGMTDACQGDSGGPLQVYDPQLNIYYLVGIVSWGEGCARPNIPGVYTRVTRYLYWIYKNTKFSCRCGIPKSMIIN